MQQRALTSRHIQMIAIGGTIGTGFFIGSGATIALAGPLGALIGFSIVSLMVYSVMTSLGELATHLPVSGSFTTFATKYVDPALGAALGYNYWIQWAISLPSELNAVGIIMAFWTPSVPSVAYSASILTILVLINTRSVKGFGEVEFWLSLLKVVTIILFIISGLFINFGWIGKEKRFIGFEYWNIDGKGPIKDGAIGIFNVFLMAFFTFGGTELVAITAGETKDPKTTIPKAIKNTFWRILLFFILSIFVIGLVIRHDDPSLLNSSNNNDITVAPFTLVFDRVGIPFAANLMNIVIMTAIVSAGNSALYASSRTLMTLALEGKTSAMFKKVNKDGIPINAILATAAVGCISFLGIVLGEGVLFTLLINITGISGIITWMSIALIHIRFRQAMKKQRVDLSTLHYTAPLYPLGPIIAFVVGFGIIIAQGYASYNQPNGLYHLILTYRN
ncbi:amino acid permease/ SLC12A domain-containing protein [Globomyces pollinis-pini]|nr:amino acid permease/ SLC12A domain-containing protein [Globomyces pollinis-pini]